MMLRTWVATVASEMNSRAPICLLLKPSAINCATSACRFASSPEKLASSSDLVRSGLPEAEAHGRVPAHVFACLKFGLELRSTQQSNGQLFGTRQCWNHRPHHARACTSRHSFCRSEHLRCKSPLPRVCCVPAHRREPVILGEPIIDLSCYPQSFDHPRLCRVDVAGDQSDHAKVAKHRFNLIQVAGFSTEAHALQRDSPRGLQVPLD